MKLVYHLATAIAALATAGAAVAGSAEDLIAANKCSKCHTAKTTKKAPSFASIAEQYKGQADASAKLVQMLKSGPNEHDKLAASDADLKAVADFVLSSK
ncbi:MAG TPA: c-type cytochrome [Burkholderiaceae bacterium]|nr:c-type cytochrome [Burkholderiaceae bacterium]